MWEDSRNSSSSSEDIYGARVSKAGVLLDGPAATGGIAISTATGDQQYPSVAFDGANYLVVWMDYRSGSAWNIYGTLVGKAGGVLAPSGFAISNVDTYQYHPAVAFNGATYLVTWSDNHGGSVPHIYGTFMSTAGTVLDETGFLISSDAHEQTYPAASFDGTNYLVVWDDNRNG